MTTPAVAPIRLNTEVQNVKCPACKGTGNSIRTMELISNSEAAGLGILTCCCNPAAFTAPTYTFITHYCSHCGIRLSIVPWYEHSILQVESRFLVEKSQKPKAAAAGDEVQVITPPKSRNEKKVAASPLGLPPRVDEAAIRNFVDRFANLAPQTVLEIQHEGSFGFPELVFDKDRARVLYEISRPGMGLAKDGRPDPAGYSAQDPMSAEPSKGTKLSSLPWDPETSTPHIRVCSVDPRVELATVQVFHSEVDFILHTPQHTPSGTTTYTSARSGTKAQPESKAAYLLWTSSAGPLLWMNRRARDSTTPADKATRTQLVLLDGYDRLVAMVTKSAALERADASNGKKVAFEMRRMHLYGEFGAGLVGEILASYAAVRYAYWNCSQLGQDVGEGEVLGALASGAGAVADAV